MKSKNITIGKEYIIYQLKEVVRGVVESTYTGTENDKPVTGIKFKDGNGYLITSGMVVKPAGK